MSWRRIASECENKKAPVHNGDPKYCNACKRVFCDTCYDAQLVHEDEDNQRNEHEKTDLDTANFILSVFNTTAEEQNRLSDNNIHSKWFGAEIDERGKCYFNDFGGFVNLLHQSERPSHEQFPSFISFVGDTGVGKSTLINGILKLPAKITKSSIPGDILSPVMGLSYQQTHPTSGDVHLFGDRSTRDSQHPLFYVDCEGIDGGQTIPATTRYLGTSMLNKFTDLKELVHKKREMHPPISRGWATRELYPRILFPFTDVVCYVTRNPRRFEHHIETMIRWAERAIYKTTNQPMLPHAFLIFNAFSVEETPENYFQDWWGPEATSHFLETRSDLTSSSTSYLGKLTRSWNTERGRAISSLEQLIKCYYRDFRIICIPEIKSSHSRITEQYGMLQNAIRDASISARACRQDLGFLMSAETLKSYFEMAFDHFTKQPNKPFDFLSAALLRSPVTQTLKDHISKLAVRHMEIYPTKPGRTLFHEIAPWVASCIFLNSHRFELPNNDVAEMMFEQYQDFCNEAQTEFYAQKWPCEAVDKNGNRCVNMKSTHTAKGHQNHEGDIFASQDPKFKLTFKSSFETDSDKKQANEDFSQDVREQLKNCIQKYKEKISKDGLETGCLKKAVAEIHMSTFKRFEAVMKDFVSHKTCFCCLASSPAHKLFCGHVICQLCLEDYSYEQGNFICLKECPLCRSQGQELKFEMKPATAGLRILCLDGGGVRSIIQIQILKKLEEEIGLNIPIHQFFDLIVGTSGGGIVAAVIGLNGSRINDCVKLFTEFASKAFKKHTAIDWPMFGEFIVAHHHGRYKARGLENVLQETFGGGYLFGSMMDRQHRTVSSLKIAVTATSSNRRTFLLANYNRPPPEKKNAKKIKLKLKDKEEYQNDRTEIDDYQNENEVDSSVIDQRENLELRDLLDAYGDDSIQAASESIRSGSSRPKRVEDFERSSQEIQERISERVPTKNSEDISRELNQVTPDIADEGSEIEDAEEHPEDEYNNAPGAHSTYTFFRGENQGLELKVWEAIRATTAAPGYFKSFYHTATKCTFDDGALRCNNPVLIANEERKVLWPNLAKRDPDILLSIGTGFNQLSPDQLSHATQKSPKRGIKGFVRKMIKLGTAALVEDMDCTNIWDGFIGSLKFNENAPDRLKRYQRLNLELKTPLPSMDEVKQIQNMRVAAEKFFSQNPKIKEIANTLIGSLFYFELETVHSNRDKFGPKWGIKQGFHCTGKIKCRLASPILAQRIKTYQLPNSRASKKSVFLIGEQNGERKELEMYWTDDMAAGAAGTAGADINVYDVDFDLEYDDKDKDMCMYLSLWDNPAKAVSISGFPRLLYEEAESFAAGGPSKNYSSRLLQV